MSTRKTDIGLIKRYLQRESTFKEKWLNFLKRDDLKVKANTYHEKLTPFSGMSSFSSLTEEEKISSYSSYLQFIAEIQIFLEKMVVFGFYRSRKYEAGMPAEIKRSMRLLAHEELYHTNSYLHFLKQQGNSSYLFMDNRFFRTIGAYCLNINPLIITLVAAKFEAFSTPYLAELNSSSMDPNDPWYVLNKIHMEDEGFHVPIQFDIYNSSINKFGYFKTILPMLSLYMVFQLVLLLGMRNLVNKVHKEKSFFQRYFILLPKTIYWASRKMEAFQKARQIMKGQFLRKLPTYRRTLKFIYA